MAPSRAEHNCIDAVPTPTRFRLLQQHPEDRLALNQTRPIRDTKRPLQKDLHENRSFDVHLPTPAKLV